MLRTDESDAARKHNERLLGKWTLGIEVTDPVLAKRCGFGNIDPQHKKGGVGVSSAIEQALICPLPPSGSTLVTVRPDKDSFGAMAILTLRADGRQAQIDLPLISWIGAMDSVGFHNAREQYPELYELVGNDNVTGAIQVITRSPELRWSLEDRIEAISRILVGEMPSKQINDIAAMRYVNRPVEEYQYVMCGPMVGFITAPGKYHRARDWGNRRFPVAVVFDPEYRDETQEQDDDNPYPRWTLVRQMGVFDRRGFEEAINEAEAEARGISVEALSEISCRWGGPRNIVTSPKGQGHETKLTDEAILAIVREHAESGIVT